MRVKVIKAEKSTYWYSDKVGEVFETIRCWNNGRGWVVKNHLVSGDDESIYIIHEHDCEIVAEETAESSSQSDAVDSPQHYTRGGVEVIDIIAQTVSGYDDPFVAHCIGTATKYLNRAPYKHAEPTEDLRKAKRYIEFAIDHLTKEDE